MGQIMWKSSQTACLLKTPKNVNKLCRHGGFDKLLYALKDRRMVHPMFETTPLMASHTTVKYKHPNSYSVESLIQAHYDYNNYNDDNDDQYSGYGG